MKYCSITLFAIMALFITSCGGDKNSDLIVGTWNITTITYADCTDPSDDFVEVYGNADCQDCDRSSMTFNDGGSLSFLFETVSGGVVNYTDTSTGTYSFTDDDETMMLLCIDGDCFTGSLTITDSSMSWEASIEGCTATINAGM